MHITEQKQITSNKNVNNKSRWFDPRGRAVEELKSPAKMRGYYGVPAFVTDSLLPHYCHVRSKTTGRHSDHPMPQIVHNRTVPQQHIYYASSSALNRRQAVELDVNSPIARVDILGQMTVVDKFKNTWPPLVTVPSSSVVCKNRLQKTNPTNYSCPSMVFLLLHRGLLGSDDRYLRVTITDKKRDR
ncbi:hypothetical protein QTP88_028271 [Uroleucon formosanum]